MLSAITKTLLFINQFFKQYKTFMKLFVLFFEKASLLIFVLVYSVYLDII